MGAEPGVRGGRRGILILSSLAGRVVSPPTPLRGEGEWVAHGGRGGAGRDGGGASPPPDPGPKHPPLPPSEERGAQGQRWTQREPNSPPPAHQRSPKAAAQGQAGGRACPPTLRGTGPPGREHRGLGAEGRGTRRQEQGSWAEAHREEGGMESEGWRERGQEELEGEGQGRRRRRGGAEADERKERD